MNEITITEQSLRNIKLAIAQMLLHDELCFYGWMAAQFVPIVDKKTDRRMAVGYNATTHDIELYFNPDNIYQWQDEEMQTALIHESLHVILKHITRATNVIMEKELFNIAADIVVNHIILQDFVNEGILSLPTYYVSFEDPIIKFYTLEWVYKYLQSLPPKDKQKQPHADHDLWGQQTDNNTNAYAEFEDAINEAVMAHISTAATAAGNAPGIIKELLRASETPATVSWQSLLSQFIGIAFKDKPIKTWSRPPRARSPIENDDMLFYTQPGITYQEDCNIGVIIDTSGSMSNDDISNCLAEIISIAEVKQVEVAEVDTQIQRTWIYNKHTPIKDVKGRGGTDMNPGLKYFDEKHDIGCIVIMTDGALFRLPIETQKTTLWLLTPDGTDYHLKKQNIIRMT